MTQQQCRQTTIRREHALASPPRMLNPFGAVAETAQPWDELRLGPARYALRTLLVPLDGTQHAEHALPYALAIARRSHARIRLVRVHLREHLVDPWRMHPVNSWLEREKREEYDYLVEVAARIARISSVEVETRLVEGVDAVASLATESARADLVVMASRRRGFLRRLFSPSIANGLRRRIQTPGLFVKGYSSPVDLTGDPIARHILVPLNGTVHAERILGYATAVSRLEGARLSLVNVQNRAWNLGMFLHTTPASYLSGIARDVQNVGAPVDVRVITTEGSIGTAVAAFAKRQSVDVIALATQADGDWTQVLQGNFADALLRKTDLPLLVLGVDGQRKRAKATTLVES